jgi:hypothetical protein
MYDKGEKEDLSEFKQTEYWEAVQNFQKWIVNEARTNGLPPERLGEAVHLALSTAKPKQVVSLRYEINQLFELVRQPKFHIGVPKTIRSAF